MLSALMQVAPTPVPAPVSTDVLGQIVAAFQSHNYVLLAALVAYFGVAFAKQGWLGKWFTNHVPAAYMPYVAMFAGVVTTVAAELIAGMPLPKALLDGLTGLIGAAMAVLTHQTVVEQMRGGKEIIPKAPGSNLPPSAPPPNASNPPPAPPTVPDVKADTLILPKESKTLMLKYARALVASLCLGLVVLSTGTGCSALQWASFVNAAGSFITYVQTALNLAETIWAVVQPLIPVDQSKAATAAFSDAKLILDNALTALQDAINAGNATQTAPTNYAALEASVQDAFAALAAVVEKWQPIGTPKAAMSPLVHAASAIKAWK